MAVSLDITVQRLSKRVTYVSAPSSVVMERQPQPSGERKPLTLLLPWLGSRPQAVEKYCDIYLRADCDVLVVESDVRHFLWPRSGVDEGLRLLELLQSDRFVSRPLLVHAFSIGGFTYTQLLLQMSQDQQKYQALTQRIKGQIYDSLVIGSVELMATGLGKSVYPGWEKLIKNAALTYFSVFRRHTTDYFDVCIDAFRNSPVRAPALFFYCENDVISDYLAVEEMMAHLRTRGIEVTGKKWEDSTHAGHLKRHQQEYLTSVNAFLQSLRLVPLKARM
ncbi:transmembrane protein 53-A [Brachionichthys hirsutus]|uniref:transmembrane protein 53-A n=1 Tax=Brachionichthys hirsutus TaxID=412623 RepID=UPI00360484E8